MTTPFRNVTPNGSGVAASLLIVLSFTGLVVLPVVFKSGIGGVALQFADLNGRGFHVVVHAIAHTERFYGADPGTTHPQDIRIENGFGCAFDIVIGNAANESWNVDGGGASGDTGGIETVEAPIGLCDGLVGGIRFFKILKDAFGAFCRQLSHKTSPR